MSSKTKTETKEAVKDEVVKTPAKQEAELYTISELAGVAKEQFETRPECVMAALKTAGMEMATLDKAKEIVKEFLTQEVE